MVIDMLNNKVAWLEGVKITYQHMQLSEELILNKVFSLFRNVFCLNKAVIELNYKIDRKCLSITKALVVGKNNVLSAIEEGVTIDFSSVDPGIYDINIHTDDASGINGAPGYKNDSCGALVSIKENFDKYDKSRAKDILMVRPKINCYLTLVIDGENFFEEDNSVPALRVNWDGHKIFITEELYSYNISSKLFLDALSNFSCDIAEHIGNLVKSKIYTSYSEIYKDLYFTKNNYKENGDYNIKHGQRIVIDFLKKINVAENRSKKIVENIKVFEKDACDIWFYKGKIEYGYIKCELKTNISDIKEIESLILIQDYSKIMSCYQSRLPGIPIEIKDFNKTNERVLLCIKVNWSDLDIVAVKTLFDMEILKIWIAF